MYGNPYYAPYQYPYTPQNTDFKAQYQQPIQNTSQQFNAPQTANTPLRNEMLWVLNKNEADSYPVAPNCSVVLWDKNSPTIYVKSMSANGVPSMRTLDFTERSEKPVEPPKTDENYLRDKFATLDQLNAVQGEIDGLKAKLAKFNAVEVEEKPKSATKKAKGGDE